RQRAASSSSSEEEPVSPLGPDPGSDREAEAEGSEGDPCNAASSPEGPGATAAERPRPSEEPPPSEGPGGGRALLSFGSEEEREGEEELFKIKKPSFNEVTFRIQKKESLLSAEGESEECRRISHLEPGAGSTKGAQEQEEESSSSLSEGYNSADSENESNLSQRRKNLSPGGIPSADCVEAARRRRHLARTQADYLPLDVSNGRQVSQRREGSDLESEDESEMSNLHFAPKMRTLRQRMAEHMGEFVPLLPVVV
ncbi:GCFC2 factor, partial [Penelope pileata]|nr:GCFC2 factor [Penelope pileata]